MRIVTVLMALTLLAVALFLIPTTRRGMLVAAQHVSVSMPRMLMPGR